MDDAFCTRSSEFTVSGFQRFSKWIFSAHSDRETSRIERQLRLGILYSHFLAHTRSCT